MSSRRKESKAAVPRRSLRLLMVEDSENDALILLDALQRGGFDPLHQRVETPEAMKLALDKEGWDLILADHSLPEFSAPAALELVQRRGLDVPFIIVSGQMDEEAASEAMKAGAHDYIMKGRLSRLVPAVQRELRE